MTETQPGTFFARLVLSHDGGDLILDSRPSDCVALAVRAKCPIFIDEGVVDEAGIPISATEAGTAPAKSAEVETQIAVLEKQLQEAVDEENYEQAAMLRDRIKELQSKL